jgi:hypothetical protein
MFLRPVHPIQAWPRLKQPKRNGGSDDTAATHHHGTLAISQDLDTSTAMISRSSDLSRRSARQQAGLLARIADAIRAFFSALTTSYHPERHYMRGGGTGGVA